MIWVVIALVLLITGYTIRKFWLEKRKMDQEAAADAKVALPDFIEMPMMERDYMLRYLEAFTKALSEAIAQRKDDRLDEALRTIEAVFADDREARALVDLPLPEFIEKIDFMAEFNAQKWSLVAELLFERATVNAIDPEKPAQDPDICTIDYIKSLHLALEVLVSDPETYRQTTIDLVRDLRSILQDTALPTSTLQLIGEYDSGSN